MSASTPTPGPLRIDGILPLLPETEALRPLAEYLLAAARPDPARRWTGSGELGTAGSRLVDVEALEREIPMIVAAEAARIERRGRTIASLARALQTESMEEAMTVLIEEGEAIEMEDIAEEAEAWYLAARALGLREGSPRSAEALRKASRAARARAALDRAAEGYERAWREADEADAAEDAVVAATGRGNVAVDRGAWEEAEGWYRIGLERLERPPFVGSAGSALRWPLAQNLAITARERGRLADAAEWLERAERWAGEADAEARAAGREPDERYLLDIANGWGQLALAAGDPALAEARFREALKGPGAPLSRVGVIVNLAEALLQLGRILEAGVAARQAEAEALARRVPGRLPEIYRLLARVSEAREEPGAFIFLEHALELIRRHELPRHEEILTLREWARVRRADGEEDAARAAEARADELNAIEEAR